MQPWTARSRVDARSGSSLDDLAHAVAAQIETLGARESTVVLRPEAPIAHMPARLWSIVLRVGHRLPLPGGIARRLMVSDAQRAAAERQLTHR